MNDCDENTSFLFSSFLLHKRVAVYIKTFCSYLMSPGTIFSLLRYLCCTGFIARVDLLQKSIHCHSQHFSMKQQLTLNGSSQHKVVIVESSHEIQVTIAKGLRDGGKLKVVAVNHMLDSYISSVNTTLNRFYVTNIAY